MLERFARLSRLLGINTERRRLETAEGLRSQYTAEHPGERELFEKLQDELTDTEDPSRRAELIEQLANMPYYTDVDVPMQDAEHSHLEAKQQMARMESKN